MPKISDPTLRAMPPNTMVWDDDLPGFGVRAGKTAKTFLVLVASGRRHKLGRYPLMSLAQARQKARDMLAQKQLGADFTRVSYKNLKAEFLADKQGNIRQKTYDSYEWLLGRLSLPEDAKTITPRLITEATKDLAPSVKQHATAVLKIMFRWAVNKGYLKQSPAETFTVRKSKARKRVLTDDELKKVWHACPNNGFGTTVRLLILTGQRKSEVEHFQLDGDLVTVDGAFIKNHADHTFPVTGITLDLIGRDRSWGGWSKSKADLDKASGVTGYTLHDLRRTFRTNWAKLRLPREVAEKYINHLSGVQDPVERTYDQHDYLPEMRECIKVYTSHLEQLLSP